MKDIITRRLGVKIALTVNLFILIIVACGTYLLIAQESKRLEDELLRKGQILSMIGAKMISTVLEEAIDNGALSQDDAFDTEYKQIENSTPPKYHNKFDKYLDKAILELQDEFLKDESALYAVASDRNGYVPTHNTRYQQSLTGDPEKDKAGNRTKRLFNDPIGLKAAQNTTQALLQTYYRDTGETIWDISSPVQVRGQHWGCFRIGLSLAKIAQAKRDTSFTLFSIMGTILLTSMMLTFFIVNKSLIPVRELSQTANGLAKGQYLHKEIASTSSDEIGELQVSLERLRLSMLIALKRIKKF
ncbi:MAG: hypothetical protein PVI90_10430 [Desulfobacteraceae bacterium]|jgi:HAMP domain-containing protein